MEQWRRALGLGLGASVWRYRMLVAAAALTSAIAGYGLALLEPETYEAVATIVLADPRDQGVPAGSGPPTLEAYVASEAARVTSQPVLARAAERLGGQLSAGELRDRVEVTGDAQLMTITVVARDDTRAGAAEVANELAVAYGAMAEERAEGDAGPVLVGLERLRKDLTTQIEEVRAQLAQLPPQAASTDLDTRLQVLASQLIEFETRVGSALLAAAQTGSAVQDVEEAVTPTESSASAPGLFAVLAGVLGAGLGSVGAYWRAGRDARVRSASEAAMLLNAPLLAEVPRSKPLLRSAEDGMDIDERSPSMSYRHVLAAVESILSERGGSAVLVLDFASSTGKATTALHLARAAARNRRSVVLVDADLRDQPLSKMVRRGNPFRAHQESFDVDRGPGLMDLALGIASLSECLWRYDVSGSAGIRVVSGRGTPGDTAGMLRTHGVREAMQQIEDAAELVIVHAPRRLDAADAYVIAAHVDGIVVAVKHGSSPNELHRLRQRLEFMPAALLGHIYVS